MKILVTGGAGYIGSHTVVELYNAGHDVVIVDNFSNSSKDVLTGLKGITGKDFSVYEVDCLNFNALKSVFEKEKFDGVIHFAAKKSVTESVEKPLMYYHDNLLSLINVLKLCSECAVPNVIFSSSCTIYGDPEIIPVTEKTPINPKSPYGRTKVFCEEIIKDFCEVSNVKAVILRYFNPVGAHPSGLIGELPKGTPSSLVPRITQVAAGILPKLTVFGDKFDTPDGSQVRDYIHIVDLAKAHVAAFQYMADKNDFKYDIFNVGTGGGNSVFQIINAFEKASGLKLNYEIGPERPGEVVKVWADTTKIESTLGWKATLNIEDATRDAWNWQKRLSNMV